MMSLRELDGVSESQGSGPTLIHAVEAVGVARPVRPSGSHP